MRVVIFSDVHGNLPAFEAMLHDAGTCDQYICLGDLVNYGPWSNECVDLAGALKNVVLLSGNHEEAFLQGFYPGENELVKTFFQQTYSQFNRFEQIRSYQTGYDNWNYHFRHTILDSYIYPDTKVQLDANYVIGHSHHQFRYDEGGHHLYNAGSVGQNRAYINVVNYLVFDSESGAMEMKAHIYDLDLLVNKMKSMAYPDDCIAYYTNKKKA